MMCACGRPRDLTPRVWTLRAAEEKAAAEGWSIPFRAGDFLRDPPWQTFDWVFEHTFFCAITPSRRVDYVRAMRRWIRPGGYLLAIHYMIPDTEGPPFGTNREELMDRFMPHFDLLEEKVPRSYEHRTGLELLLWWRRRAEDGAVVE
jgi:methyl halide transferase